MLDASILIATLVVGAALWLPRLRDMPAWRAMITPLASIIGSGFLLLGPILTHAYGAWAPLAMAALCAIAWLFGAAVRENIRIIETEGEGRPRIEMLLDRAGQLALGFAYMISVAYYLNLFGAFGLSLTPWPGHLPAQILTTATYLVILGTGMSWGFRMLERLEYVSVSLKLAIIAGLILGLAVHFTGAARSGALHILPTQVSGWHALALGFGLIVTVQGFETARFLGATYPAPVRIRAMRWAQMLSAAIYLAYIGCFAYVFAPDQTVMKETAIVQMMAVVAPILPLLLVAAALAAQFSAAVADTGGAGGLFAEISGGRLTPRRGYLLLTVVGLALTWTLDVFHIVAYASRAFAFYYAIEAAVAALACWRRDAPALKTWGFAALMVLGIAITIFGLPAEG